MMVEYQILERLKRIEKLINSSPELWMDINGVVKYTSISKSVITKLVAQGKLKVSKSTGKRLFKKEWIDTLLEGK